MAFFSKNPKEPIPEVETSIWSCASENCSGWMRKDFSFEEKPECPLCQSDMVSDTRVLPELKNGV